MKINDIFKTILVCAILAVVVPPNLWAESTASEKQLATQKSQGLINQLNALEKKYEPEVKSAMGESNINKKIFKYGEVLKKLSNEVYITISQFDVPEEVKNAALEYAQAISNLSTVCVTAPYMPSDNFEAFVDGALHGLMLDSTRPAKLDAARRDFRQRYDAAFTEITKKKDSLMITAIKHGVKYR